MNLWIRSQDKEDLVNNPLRIYYDCNYEGVHKVVANTYDETIYLGTYKTKERALEVLDEIQEFIEDIEKSYIEVEGDMISQQIIYPKKVYEMPKE